MDEMNVSYFEESKTMNDNEVLILGCAAGILPPCGQNLVLPL